MVLDTVEMASPLKSLIGACVPSTGQMQKCAKRCRELSIVTLVGRTVLAAVAQG